MKKQYHLICIVASLLFWLVGCSAIQIKDVPVSISQAPLENEEISNSEQAESPLEAEDSTSVTITESGDFSEAEQLGFAGANIGQGGLMAGDGEWVYFRSEFDWGLYRARTDGSEQTQLLPPEDYAPSSINVLGGWVFFSNFRMEVKQKSSWMVIAIRSL